MSKKDELYSIFKAIRSANARYKTYPSNYTDKLNRIMYRKNQGGKYKLAEGGAPTMQQFFDYGYPTPGLPYTFQQGGAATPDMLASAQQMGQLPMMQMGQSFADSQMQDAARYGYMAKGGQASNSKSTFPNEKLGKFIGSVKGKAEASVQRELMNAYDAPYTQQEVSQAMMQSQLPRADWGGGFQNPANGMEGANIDYDKLSKINTMFEQKAPDLRGSLGAFGKSFDNQYAKQVTISDVDKPYWKEAEGTEDLNNLSKWAPETKEVYNPKFIQKAYGGISMYKPGGPFEKYEGSGNEVLEFKSQADFDELQSIVNQVRNSPGEYSPRDIKIANAYLQLIQKEGPNIQKALANRAPGITSVGLANPAVSIPADVEKTRKEARASRDWRENMSFDSGTGEGDFMTPTEDPSYRTPRDFSFPEDNPAYIQSMSPTEDQAYLQDQRNTIFNWGNGYDARYMKLPSGDYMLDRSIRDPEWQAQMDQDLNEFNVENKRLRDFQNTPINASMPQFDQSIVSENMPGTGIPVTGMFQSKEGYGYGRNTIPFQTEDGPLPNPGESFVAENQPPANAQSEIQYAGIDPVNEGFDANTKDNAILLQDPATGEYVYRAPDGTELGRSMDQNTASLKKDSYFVNQTAQSAGAPPASTDPTAGMTKEQRLEYYRKQRNLPEGTVMLPPAVAGSKQQKDTIIADQKEKEKAAAEQKETPPSSTEGKETKTEGEPKKEETPAATTTTGTTPAAGTPQQQVNPMSYGNARISAVEADYRLNPFGFMGSKDKEGNVIRDEKGRRVKTPGQVKRQRVEFGYVPMPAVGPQAAPPITPAAPAASAEPAASSTPAATTTTTPAKTPTPEELAAQAELNKKAAETPAAAPSYNQARNLGAPPTQAYGGALYKFVDGGDSKFPIPGVDPTKFNQSAYDEMVAQAGPAPEDMQNPMLVTNQAEYEYGRNWADTGMTGMQAITDLKRSIDYKKEQAKLPNQLASANLFKEQDNNDRGNYAVNSGMLGIGNTTTGMRMSKYGGDENSEGNIYFLDEDTIRQIMAMGGIVEYLD